MTLDDALLAVLMYLPDRLARRYAQDQLVVAQRGGDVDMRILVRIVKLVDARALTAQHVDVYRAREVIAQRAQLCDNRISW